MTHYRYFQVIAVSSNQVAKKGSDNFFRVKAHNPISAVRKAGTKICNMTKVRGQCTLEITLKEDTRGSDGKEYKYKIKRTRLTPERVVNIAGNEVVFNYEIDVKAI